MKSAHESLKDKTTRRFKAIAYYFLFLFCLSKNGYATEVTLTVADVGAGLCVIIKSDDELMIYDAGHWVGEHCLNAVKNTADNAFIKLLVLSHSDADHIGNADKILRDFSVGTIVRTGNARWDSRTWRKMNAAVAKEVSEGASVINLATASEEWKATTYRVGSATVEFLFGLSQWPEPGLSQSEQRNAISIVAKLTLDDMSVLLIGDAIGRELDDDLLACKNTEALLIRESMEALNIDVLVASHHGGDNASADCFIRATTPEFVVFSSGHKHKHPRKSTARRFLNAGLEASRMFRTDRGDDEGSKEWDYLRIEGCRDRPGDDDVEISMTTTPEKAIKVQYLETQANDC